MIDKNTTHLEAQFANLNNQLYKLDNTTHRISLGEVFKEKNYSYLNEFTLFAAHFNTIPNFIHEVDIDCIKANDWFIEKHKDDIKQYYFDKRCYRRNRKSDYDDIFYFLYDDLLVYFDTNNAIVRFLFSHTHITQVNAIVDEIKKFRERTRKESRIYILYNTPNGLDKKPLKVSKSILRIADNYNDDFKDVHEVITQKLNKKNGSGLVLLHGKPGTGKTYYIRYLIATVRKKVIFLPPSMMHNLTGPVLIDVLINNPNSIFVIEDAENVILARDVKHDSPVSALLNISDGLLSDCLNIQIICSFNTDISKVDSALMRKGRLIAKYEFKELEVNKAQALSDKLGFNKCINQSMTLTDIYNQADKDFHPINKRNAIGFSTVGVN